MILSSGILNTPVFPIHLNASKCVLSSSKYTGHSCLVLGFGGKASRRYLGGSWPFYWEKEEKYAPVLNLELMRQVGVECVQACMWFWLPPLINMKIYMNGFYFLHSGQRVLFLFFWNLSEFVHCSDIIKFHEYSSFKQRKDIFSIIKILSFICLTRSVLQLHFSFFISFLSFLSIIIILLLMVKK